MVDKEKIRDELLLHAAKTIIARSYGAADKYYQLMFTVNSFLVPIYLAALKIAREQNQEAINLFHSIPAVLFFFSVITITLVVYPRNVLFDLKNPAQIISQYQSKLQFDSRWIILSSFLTFSGIVSGIYLLLK